LSEKAPSRSFSVGESRSLAKLASGKDDLVGLIAYGIYKFEQSEWARSCKPTSDEVSKHSATLQETRIQSLRSNAEVRLSEYIQTMELQWRQELYAEIKSEVLDHVANEFENRIASRFVDLSDSLRHATGFWRSIGTNVVAWVITLFITFLVLATYFSPAVRIVATGS
jgi:hypothetical protein